MSKKCIVTAVTGSINDIVEDGDEFPIYEGPDATLKWVDVPDDIDLATMNNPKMVNGTIIDTRPETETVEYLRLERKHAYLQAEEQLDMIYKDNRDGTRVWDDHIDAVKAMKKPSEGVEDFNWGLIYNKKKPAWEVEDEADYMNEE